MGTWWWCFLWEGSNEGRPFCCLRMQANGKVSRKKWLMQARLGTVVLRYWCCKAIVLFVETYGTEQGALTADDITNIIKMEFDCRPGAIAVTLALREPKYQETAAYCHFGREPYTKDGKKFFEWENAKDCSKYASMTSELVTSAVKASNYLQKWVD